MVKLKKAFKRSFALVAAVVVSVVAFCFPAAAATSSSFPLSRFQRSFRGFKDSTGINATAGNAGSYSAFGYTYTTFPVTFSSPVNKALFGFLVSPGSKPFFSLKPDTVYTISGSVLVVNDNTASLAQQICLILIDSLVDPSVEYRFYSPSYVHYTAEGDRRFDFSFTFSQSNFPKLMDCFGFAVRVDFGSTFTYTNVGITSLKITQSSKTEEIIDGIGDKVDENTNKITGNTDPDVGGAGDKADELNGQIGDYNQKEDEVIDLLQTSTDDALLKYNPFQQLNFMALAVAFSGFTSTFNSIIASLGVHFSTVIAFSVCAGFFALIVGIVIRPGNRPPPKD